MYGFTVTENTQCAGQNENVSGVSQAVEQVETNDVDMLISTAIVARTDSIDGIPVDTLEAELASLIMQSSSGIESSGEAGVN
eukprot:3719548-Amphidinium_carterae.1